MFWENLKKECELQNISLKELSDKSGLVYGTIRNSITRNSLPAVDIAYKLAKALNVSIEYLLTGQKIENSKIKELETKIELIRQIVK